MPDRSSGADDRDGGDDRRRIPAPRSEPGDESEPHPASLRSPTGRLWGLLALQLGLLGVLVVVLGVAVAVDFFGFAHNGLVPAASGRAAVLTHGLLRAGPAAVAVGYVAVVAGTVAVATVRSPAGWRRHLALGAGLFGLCPAVPVAGLLLTPGVPLPHVARVFASLSVIPGGENLAAIVAPVLVVAVAARGVGYLDRSLVRYSVGVNVALVVAALGVVFGYLLVPGTRAPGTLPAGLVVVPVGAAGLLVVVLLVPSALPESPGASVALVAVVLGAAVVVPAVVPVGDAVERERLSVAVGFDAEYVPAEDGDGASAGVGVLRIEHVGGDPVPADRLRVEGEGFADVAGANLTGPGTWAGAGVTGGDGAVEASDAVTVGVTGDCRIDVVYVTDDFRRHLDSFECPTPGP